MPEGNATPTTPNNGATPPEITPALVRQVADRVYAMLLRDLRLERERSKGMLHNSHRSKMRGSL